MASTARLLLAIGFVLASTATVSAQSQSYKTGYGRTQPPPATRQAPSSGLSLTTGTLAVTGLVAGAALLGLALADSGGGDDSEGNGSDTPSIGSTSTQ